MLTHLLAQQDSPDSVAFTPYHAAKTPYLSKCPPPIFKAVGSVADEL